MIQQPIQDASQGNSDLARATDCAVHARRGKAGALAALALAAFLPTAASAEEWKTNLMAYMLVPWADFGVQTAGGADVGVSADPGDVIDALDFGLMFAGDTHRGKISLLYDVFYSDLGASGTLSGPLASSLDVDVKMLLASFAVGYDLHRTDTSFAQIFGGARYVSLESTATATGGGPIGVTVGVDRDDDYLEPLIGLRGRTKVGERTSFGGYVNVGGFGAGSEFTLDSYVGLDIEISDRMSTNIGLRYLTIDYEKANADIDMDMYGPVLGLSWRF